MELGTVRRVNGVTAAAAAAVVCCVRFGASHWRRIVFFLFSFFAPILYLFYGNKEQAERVSEDQYS